MLTLRRPHLIFTALTLLAVGAFPVLAQETSTGQAGSSRRSSPNQPARTRPANPADDAPAPGPARRAARFPRDIRTVDGTGNNPDHPEWGSAGIAFLRLTEVGYSDGAGTPVEGPSARAISNSCAAQTESIVNHARASDFLWQWGQFLDHDIDLTPVVDPGESFDIPVPAGDLWFDSFATGETTISLDRSLYEVVDGVRQQVNEITAFIDASNVYGSDEERAQELRTLDGTGRLATSTGDLLPFNENGLPNAPAASPTFFLAGDFRANEQVGLTAMHTLFVREHNHWADTFREKFPRQSGEEIYERARAVVAAELQAITYREFLPALLGARAVAPYRGYDPQVNPGIANVFATAAYRMGHSMLSSQLMRLNEDGEEVAVGHLALADAFFSPEEIVNHGIEPLLRGLASQRAQAIDNYVIDDVRNFLFGPPGAGGLDLASLNIQRGRDHGLPSYNQVRLDYGLEPAASFAEIHPDPTVQANLAAVYETVDDIDVWVGGLAEPHAPGALVGETWLVILKDQFERLRDGDRFWYEGYLPRSLVRLVKRQSLARIIRRNTEIGREIQNNPFRVRPPRP